MSTLLNINYKGFLEEIKEQIYQSQYQALKKVNKELIELYWFIGKSIIEKQQLHNWGESVVEDLARDLQKEFVGIKGFSSANLWRMRKFYQEYQENTKLAPLVREIGWSHNVLLFEKLKDDLEREFYIKMTIKYGWSKAILIHQIEGKAYQQFLLNQTNFDKALEEKYKHQAKLAVKDSYSFAFLEIQESYNERELEQALIKNIRSFLLEMGNDFAFMGNQYKITVGEDDFYLDLLLYHRRLKSLVVIELKTTKFKPEYAGKMQFYLTALNEQVKTEDENPSIGILICKEKNRTVVEYALKTATVPIGVASYTISETLPKELKELLPSKEQISESLKKLI